MVDLHAEKLTASKHRLLPIADVATAEISFGNRTPAPPLCMCDKNGRRSRFTVVISEQLVGLGAMRESAGARAKQNDVHAQKGHCHANQVRHGRLGRRESRLVNAV